jgi:DNA-binding transcriptional MerR regulator
MDMDIAEVRAVTGLTAAALHHYEDMGLVESIGRRGLRRQYAPEVIEQLAVIVICRRAGFSLKEIASMMKRDDRASWRDVARMRADELDRRIAELELARDGIRHALTCPSSDIMACVHFQSSLAQVFAS